MISIIFKYYDFIKQKDIMYDSEKGCMVFKDSAERAQWDNKCRQIVMKEYCSTEDFNYEKWKKDGERFLEEDFIDGASFPFLNDGRPELFEWANGTNIICTSLDIWYDYSSSYLAYDFLFYMYHIYVWKKKSSYVEDIKMALAHLMCNMEWDY